MKSSHSERLGYADFRDSLLIFYRFRNFSLEFFLSSDAIRSFLSIVFEQLFLQ